MSSATTSPYLAQVERLLTATRQGYKRLQCGCHTPYFVELGVKGRDGTEAAYQALRAGLEAHGCQFGPEMVRP